MNTVLLKNYTFIPLNRSEILRYAGMAGCKESGLLEECIRQAEGVCRFQVCYEEWDIRQTDKGLDLGFTVTQSKDLQKNLDGCHAIIVFAATVGSGLDYLIERNKRLSPARAMLFQALGAERVESLCDRFCTDLKLQYKKVRPRFSPGYGDLPLEMQTAIFSVLDCPRKIGVSLNNSLLMSPSKSVTAVVGVDEPARCI